MLVMRGGTHGQTHERLQCDGCPNNCEVVCILREQQFLDAWGNRCPAGIVRVRERLAAASTSGKHAEAICQQTELCLQ